MTSLENETKIRRTQFTIDIRRGGYESTFDDNRRKLIKQREEEKRPLSREKMTQFEKCFLKLKSARNEEELMLALIEIRQLMCDITNIDHAPFQEFIESGLLDPIMAYLGAKSNAENSFMENVKIETSWIISNVVLCSSDQFSLFIDRGIIQIVHDNLSTEDPKLMKNLLWIMSNMVAEDISVLIPFYRIGSFETLLNSLQKLYDVRDIAEVAGMLLSNVVKCKGFFPFSLESKFAEIVAKFIRTHKDPAVLMESLWFFAYFLDKNPDNSPHIDFASNLDLEGHFINSATKSDSMLYKPAIRSLACLSLGKSKVVEKLLRPPMFKALPKLLNKEPCQSLTDSLWMVNNILQTDRISHESLADKNFLEKILSIAAGPFYSGSSEIAVEVLISFLKFLYVEELRFFLKSFNVVEFFLDQIGRTDVTQKFIIKSLEFLFCIIHFEDIFKQGDIRAYFVRSRYISNLEHLSYSESIRISDLKRRILKLLEEN